MRAFDLFARPRFEALRDADSRAMVHWLPKGSITVAMRFPMDAVDEFRLDKAMLVIEPLDDIGMPPRSPRLTCSSSQSAETLRFRSEGELRLRPKGPF